jgi:hypothetical protein
MTSSSPSEDPFHFLLPDVGYFVPSFSIQDEKDLVEIRLRTCKKIHSNINRTIQSGRVGGDEECINNFEFKKKFWEELIRLLSLHK